MPWIKHRGGPIEADFRLGWEGRILAELAYEDPKEDLSVTVLHESGWCSPALAVVTRLGYRGVVSADDIHSAAARR